MLNIIKTKIALLNKSPEEKIPHGFTCEGIAVNGDGKTIYRCPYYKKKNGIVYCKCMKKYSIGLTDELSDNVKICYTNIEKFPCENNENNIDIKKCLGKEIMGCKYCPYEKLRINNY